ncbi:cytochrome P460 family protein [Rhizobium rhizogenes]|uniref:cytochrome P460 family protein n=1 Tax=Rhizobium rhizogenes TaxID=359 RepID=UPI0028696C17|nr:cytochrome P460 family protein [Rhizobium rhizogenes]
MGVERLGAGGAPSRRCFVENDATVSVFRRSLAEGVGTAMLMMAVVGSGLHVGGSELTAAMAISGSLIGLILAFGAVPGGHFNPTITLMQWFSGQRNSACTVGYIICQIAGGLIGTPVSSIVFGVPVGRPVFDFPPVSSLASEGLASFGLMTVVFSCSRSTNKVVGPFAVGLWLLAAILSTPTGSIANPAVAISLLAAPASTSVVAVTLFVVVQIIGGGVAALAVSTIYPDVEVEMRKITAFCLVAAGVAAVSVGAASLASDNVSPIYGVSLPEGYRGWQMITVAHEAGKNNDIRGILGNDIAAKAFREGTRSFPDGFVIARLAYVYKSSPENDAVFPAPQSFVAGDPTNVQISVKDSKNYADSGGWG